MTNKEKLLNKINSYNNKELAIFMHLHNISTADENNTEDWNEDDYVQWLSQESKKDCVKISDKDSDFVNKKALEKRDDTDVTDVPQIKKFLDIEKRLKEKGFLELEDLVENIIKSLRWIFNRLCNLYFDVGIIFSRLDKLEKCNRIAEVKEHIEERLKEETKDIIKNMQPITKEDVEELSNKIGLCAEEVRQNKTADELFNELGYIREDSFRGCIAYWCNKYKTRITINWNYKKMTDFEYQKSRGSCSVSDTITKKEDEVIHRKIKELKKYKYIKE